VRDYESIFILNPTLDETESEKVNLRMQEVIKGNGGEVVRVEKWGKRKLAYPIRKHKKGEYVLVQFQGGAATVAELERNYKMTDAVIKYLTVRLEKEALAHLARQAAAAQAAEAVAAKAEAASEKAEAPAEAPAESGEEA
jgi:small subunit ribosomal protein S6